MPDMRWRVALVTTFPPGAGSLNEYAFHFVNALRRKPEVAEIVLLTDELPEDQTYSTDAIGAAGEASVRFRPCWRFGALDNAWRIRQAVMAEQPDFVLFNIQFASFGQGKVAASLGLYTPWLVKRAGFPTIVLLHNIMETVDLKTAGFAHNPLLEWVIRTAGRVVTRAILSADLVALTIPKYVEILQERYQADNVVLAPHGAFDDVPMPSFDLPPGPLQIMTFGKFGTYKRVETLIEAFQLLQDGSRPPLELVIAGGDSPNAPGYLESMRQQYAHVPNLRFTGYVAEEDVPALFQAAAVTIFPYTSTTGSSGVLHQAGSFGKAAVLPNIGDFAEVITEEGYTGEFFEPGEPAKMAQAMARVIDYPERRIAIGRQNYLAARGIPIAEVVDWYLIHAQELIAARKQPQTNGRSR